MFNGLFRKSKEKRRSIKRMEKTEEEINNAIEYFTVHKIQPTLEDIRRFTGLSINDIESSNTFQSITKE